MQHSRADTLLTQSVVIDIFEDLDPAFTETNPVLTDNMVR